jgi:integrase
MATLTKKRNSYYARIRYYENEYQKEKSVPLRTHLKTEASVRLNEVERYEHIIKDGEDYTALFSWLNPEGGKTEIVRRTVQDAIDEHLTVKNIRNQRKSTIDRARVGLKSLTNVIGNSRPISSINDDDLEKWLMKCAEKGHSPNTMACNRAKIVDFLNHCYRKEWIKKEIYFPTIENTQKEIKSVDEELFRNIQELGSVDTHFKRAFYFYISTGCRRAEPFNGEIIGNQLRVNRETSKSKSTRYVNLNPLQKEILIEMIERADFLKAKYGYKQRSIEMRYSKELKKACRELGVEDIHFHHLRNSYIIIRCAITGDIMAVSKEVGHANVTQTQRYADIPAEVVMVWFPSWKKIIMERLKLKESSNTFNVMLNDVNKPKSSLKVTGSKVIEVARLT